MKFNITAEKIEIDEFNKIISKNIKFYRIKKNKSQLDLATSMGFSSPSFFGNAEANRNGKHFSIEHIYLISKILDVSIHEIIPAS